MRKVWIFLALMNFLQDTVQSKACVAVQARSLNTNTYQPLQLTPQNVMLAASVVCATYYLYLLSLKSHQIQLLPVRPHSKQKKSKKKKNYLVESCKKGDERAVRAAIKRGAAINFKNAKTGMTPLMYATLLGHEKIVALLLAQGADYTQRDALGNCAEDYMWGNRRIRWVYLKYRIIRMVKEYALHFVNCRKP